MMIAIAVPIALSLKDLIPPPDLFLMDQRLHRQPHVARVMVHAFRLLAATGAQAEAARLWAAVYIHDLARVNDDRDDEHGYRACLRLNELPDVRALLVRGGVRSSDWELIRTAVKSHSRGEVDRQHPAHRLTALLKDADALDRVRIGDLDAGRLRLPESRRMVVFAERLYRTTSNQWEPSREYFERLWPAALRLMAETPE